MKYILNFQKRDGVGKEKAKKYRKEGKIPAVVYGKGEKTIHILVNEKEFKDILHTLRGKFPIVEMKEEKGRPFRAVIKSIQKHPITDEILHVDFHRIHAHEVVHVKVPIHLVGEPPGVKKGGLLEQLLFELPVKGSINKIPSYIEVDISNLEIGHSIHVGDLSLKGIEPDIALDTPVVTILVPKKEEEKVEEEVVAEEAPPTPAEEEEKEKEEKEEE